VVAAKCLFKTAIASVDRVVVRSFRARCWKSIASAEAIPEREQDSPSGEDEFNPVFQGKKLVPADYANRLVSA